MCQQIHPNVKMYFIQSNCKQTNKKKKELQPQTLQDSAH